MTGVLVVVVSIGSRVVEPEEEDPGCCSSAVVDVFKYSAICASTDLSSSETTGKKILLEPLEAAKKKTYS